ncbi:MAG: signal peptidase II [Nanoarchaeota archaeon]|nr:signal peptidase II [Nanoarchaeota archaeon]
MKKEIAKVPKDNSMVFLIIAIFVLIIDRITKYMALQTSYVKNYGLLFGLFSSPSLKWSYIFAISLVLVFLLYVFSLKDVKKNIRLQIGLVFMIAGLLGNLIDRLIYGFVIDFINIQITVFNFADASITLGALFVLFELFKRKGKRKPKEEIIRNKRRVKK